MTAAILLGTRCGRKAMAHASTMKATRDQRTHRLMYWRIVIAESLPRDVSRDFSSPDGDGHASRLRRPPNAQARGPAPAVPPRMEMGEVPPSTHRRRHELNTSATLHKSVSAQGACVRLTSGASATSLTATT